MGILALKVGKHGSVGLACVTDSAPWAQKYTPHSAQSLVRYRSRPTRTGARCSECALGHSLPRAPIVASTSTTTTSSEFCRPRVRRSHSCQRSRTTTAWCQKQYHGSCPAQPHLKSPTSLFSWLQQCTEHAVTWRATRDPQSEMSWLRSLKHDEREESQDCAPMFAQQGKSVV